jgi:outer membrane protein OmpA-like peptidoglycan-associated protein
MMKAPKTMPRAYVLWEPWLSRALKTPDVKLLFSSIDVPGYIVDVLVVRRELLVKRPELVKSVVKSYLRATYFYRDKMPELIMEDAKLTGERVSQEEATKISKEIQWANTLENYAYFGLIGDSQANGVDDGGQKAKRADELQFTIEKIVDVLKKTKAITEEQAASIQPHLLFNKGTEKEKGILMQLQEENFHPGQVLGIVKTGAKLEDVRVDAELPELSEAQWKSLIPVGQMRINPISFRTGTADLSMQGKRDLDDFAKRLKSMPRYYLLIAGHARAEGDPEANKALAEGRARSVNDYLLSVGVNKNKIKVISAAPSGKGGEAQSVSFELKQVAY